GTYRMTTDLSADDPLAVRLYRNDTLVSSFRRPIPSALGFLLEDGTYLAFERSDCVGTLDQDIVAVSPAGAVLWRREARSLVPEQYRSVYENPVLLGAA